MVALKQGSVPDVIANKLDHLLILTSGTEQYLITCTNKKYKFLLTTTLTISEMQMPPVTSSSEITFAEISVPLSRQEEPIHSFQEQPPVAIIKNGALSIAISNDISEALLDRIFQVIRHA